ncbi:unnamed protein product [Linum tenue]|uniref:Uncharacterized protein n=1 Tax=Linum tenue TaxID=586396 RepID=A0AAV0GN90_9ROSI|nr:unnamed protein product [Linum tenue]
MEKSKGPHRVQSIVQPRQAHQIWSSPRSPASPPTTPSSPAIGKYKVPRSEECHIHPCTKSKDKAKGTHKSRAMSHDVVASHTWRLVDCQRVSDSDWFSSATEFSGYLVASKRYNDDDNNDMR